MGSTQSIPQLLIDKSLLYTSALSDENFIVCFSAFLRTDTKASVLKAEEELCEKVSAQTYHCPPNKKSGGGAHAPPAPPPPASYASV